MAQVIPVRGVERRTGAPGRAGPVRRAIEAATGLRLEAWSDADVAAYDAGYHPFVAAVDAAFRLHLPLALSPDHLWLLVAQGFSRIVNQDPEGMRAGFVRHEGTIPLEVRRDDFVAGSRTNDWPAVFAEFSRQIRDHIGEANHADLVPDFTTTGPVERAASEIVLMEAMQSYFEYRMMTLCGIPEVRLEGTREDWWKLAACTDRLGSRHGCTWWTDHLTPWLERVAACAGGADDPELWRSIYKVENRSGGPYATGWITQCFPYLQAGGDGATERNRYLGRPVLGRGEHGGVTMDEWPGGLSRAPFEWRYFAQVRSMAFVAGFTHMTQDAATSAVRPAIGWAVAAVR